MPGFNLYQKAKSVEKLENVVCTSVYTPAKWPKNMNLAKAGNKPQPYEHTVKNNVYWFDNGKQWLAEQKARGIIDPRFAATRAVPGRR